MRQLTKGLAASLFSLVFAGPALAQPASCAGRNLLAELERSDAAAASNLRKAAEAAPNAKGVLWRIETPDAPDRAPSFLFATLALTDQRIATMPAAAKVALAQSRRIALTIEDGSAARVSEALTTVQEQALLPGGVRLEKLLVGADTTVIQRNLKRTGIEPAMSARIKPWVGLLMLSVTDCEYQRIAGGKLTMDGEIARIGEEYGIGAVGLESTEQQLLSFSSVPDDAQLALLKAALTVRPEDVNETLVQLYLARELGMIGPLRRHLAIKGGASAEAVDAAVQAQLADRTRRMRDRATGHLQMGGVFMAVGAEHIPGDNGFIALLGEAGFKLTRIE